MLKYDPNQRAFFIMALVLLMLTALFLRLGEVQLLQHDQFSQEAMAQRLYAVRQEAPRGEILDRNGRRLATSRPAYRLSLLYPYYVAGNGRGDGPSALLDSLAGMLHLDREDLYRRVREKVELQRFFEPFVVKDDLTPQETALLTELRSTNPGIYLDVHPTRYYPGGELAAHVLGYVGAINQKELEKDTKGRYRAGDQIGKTGLESEYEDRLRGEPGLMDLEVDAYFHPTNRTYERAGSTAGSTLRTTLDIDLQRTVETALARTLKYVSVNPDYQGAYFRKTDAGAAVVMDVKTGGILAMASYPTFDPNLFAGVRTDAADDAITKLFADKLFANLNRAVGTAYLPGSTWKMLSAAAALQNRVVTTDEKILCTGVYDKIEAKKDWKPEGHGWVNLESALAQSCNIYFYEMGYRLGPDRLMSMAREFGFGSPLGVDLPDEIGGCIPDSVGKREDCEPWVGGMILSAGIGQGPTATPLQLARYASVLANGGIKVHPHLVTAEVDPAGHVTDKTPPPDGRVPVSAEFLKAIVGGMKAVTEWGTSAMAFDGLPFKVAGKTGTSEVAGANNCEGDPFCQYGVYVAFAPADKPEIAVVVVGERAGHGDSMNPVARAALAQYFGVRLSIHDPLYEMGILDRPQI